MGSRDSVSAEDFVRNTWHQVQTAEDDATFTRRWVEENIDASDPGVSAIILIGGAPCEAFSSLGKQQGFRENSERSHLVYAF